MAPSIAPETTAPVPAPNSRTSTATPRLAPELTPMMEGPASGLANMVCISRPATARDIPASIAVITAGSRRSSIMCPQVSLSGVWPVSMDSTSEVGMCTDPHTMAAMAAIAAMAMAVNMAMEYRRFICLCKCRLWSRGR